MRRFGVIWVFLACGLILAMPGLDGARAQSPLPETRYVISPDTDFFGSDLEPVFDTNLDSCARQCDATESCAAFTFNSRANACFPKSAISERKIYAGALSGVKIATDPAIVSAAPARIQTLAFLGDQTLDKARRETVALALRHPAGGLSLDEVLQSAARAQAEGTALETLQFIGAAVSLSDRSDLWAEYSQLLLKLDAGSGNRRETQERALSAAINAYLRARGGPEAANALAQMAIALEKVGRGRDAVSALRAAQAEQDRPDIADALDRAIAKFGFRVTGSRVESDSEAPRICIDFSEKLVIAGQDYAAFVRTEDDRLAVTAQDSALCVDGVEHGQRYRLTLRRGLPAASGETLWKDVEISQYVRDRSPSARFPGRTYVMPRIAGAHLPIETVNLSDLELSLSRVSDRNMVRAFQEEYFGRPLSYWQSENFQTEMAEEFWTGSARVESALNQEVTTRLPLGDALKDQPAGIYALTATIPGADPYDSPGATQWFVLTDLGLSTLSATDGLHVFVRGLSDSDPREGVSVELVSRGNAVLAQAITDAEGYARFDPGLIRGQKSKAPAMIVARDGADDLSFLSLIDPAFDLSDRGVEGRKSPGPVDMFLTTDRGAYRAGETVHATVLARDAQALAIPDLPVTVVLRRPDGVEYARRVSAHGRSGGHVYALPLTATAPRGTWTLAVHLDVDAPALAETKLLVEDFLPERVDFDLSLPSPTVRPGQTPPLTFDVRYLFGAPGADLEIDGSVNLAPTREAPDWPGYKFGRHDLRLDSARTFFGGTRTDAAGRAVTAIEIPVLPEADRPLEAQITARVADGASRPVERRLNALAPPSTAIIGIRPRFDDVVPEGSEVGFDVIALDANLTPMEMPVRWTLNRVETRYQWYQLYGNWNWEPITRRTRISSGEAELGALAASVTAIVDWGQYELVVERIGGQYAAASVAFDAGWHAAADAATTPDQLEMSLDRAEYAVGDNAKLRVVARAPGTALVTVLADRVIERKWVDLPTGESAIPLTVTEDWGASAYVAVTQLRAMDVEAGQSPARALGLAHAKVAPGDRALSVSIQPPDAVKPRETARIDLQVSGAVQGEQVFVTLAAVDQGILNLTGFESPNPQGYYFGQRKLGVEIRDVYGRLIDGLTGALGEVRSGGDADQGLQRKSPPPTQDLMAVFSGLVEVGPDGRAQIDVKLPAFNGAVRLMAVAWSDRAVGQAETEMLVRDPIVATLSGPAFLTPGDSTRLLLELIHADGPAGAVELSLSATGVELTAPPATVTLGQGETRRLEIPITAQSLGLHPVALTVRTPGGESLESVFTLPVQNSDPRLPQTRRFQLAAGEAFTFDDDVFADMQPGTGAALLTAGPLARFDVPGLLAQLDRYPYGCTEQLTSQALPLLYLSSVAKSAGIADEAGINDKIDNAIVRILTRQAANGAFGLWRPQSGEFWLDAYVTDFLTRARDAGRSVPDLALTLAVDNLRNRINYAPDFDAGGEDIAYALLVLAREGKASISDLRYFADEKASAFATPLAVAQLGAALAAYGEQRRADALFAQAGRMLTAEEDRRDVWRSDFGTTLRDAAGVLRLATTSASAALDPAPLVQRLSAASGPMSTQEAAWTLLAAQALVESPEQSGLLVDGSPAAGPVLRLRDSGTGQKRVITAADGRTVNITLTTRGVPLVAPPAGGAGYTITRSYFNMDGTQRDDGDWTVGDRFVTVLRVKAAERIGARLIIDDPLPAGIEIDNPSLLRSGDVSALSWLTPSEAEHAEFRSDRFLAAVNARDGAPVTLAYIARAVSPGQFHQAAATVEDMYRPTRYARTGSRRVTIRP